MEKNLTVNLRAFALATLVPVAMMIVAMWLKPLWRDEYFSQFFADPDQSLAYLLPNRWASDPHPPAYNPVLWIWSHISIHPFWQKCLSLAILALGALAGLNIIGQEYKRRLLMFFLISLGSYWVIYFATEIRPYVMNFTLSALLTLTAVRINDEESPGASLLILWCGFGIMLSVTHYFGGLYFACLGLCLGLSRLSQGQTASFIKVGLISVIGLLPILLWLQYSYGQIALSTLPQDSSLIEKLLAGSKQFTRGLFVKTFGSNPIVTFLGLGALWAAIRQQKGIDTILIRACALTVVIAFIIHLFFIDMIKERAFIVIMPAILWIMAGGLARTQHKWARYLPMVTAIMPFLFIPEYFKTKEKIPELLEAIAPFKEQCAGTPLAVYYRPAPPEDLFKWTSEKLFQEFSGSLVDLKQADHLAHSKCPVLAVSVLLPKNDKAMIEDATAYILRAGYDLDDIKIQKFGKGRSMLWLKSTE